MKCILKHIHTHINILKVYKKSTYKTQVFMYTNNEQLEKLKSDIIYNIAKYMRCFE